MKILAVDSSGLVASVAILEDDVLLSEYTVDYKKTHSQTLMPMIDEIVRMTELDMGSLDAIAVAGGPGSFTGLRIGSSTVKGIADVLHIPVISVPTVDALAYNLVGAAGLVVPIMDARRSQVYTGIYEFNEKNELETIEPQCALAITDLLDKLNNIGRNVTFLGDGVPVFREKIAENLKVPFNFAPAHMSRQRAGAVGALAEIYYKSGKYTDASEHKPDYLRKSQAEREREEKMAGEKNA
ncbi:tRNA threonylcarbamoyl adenosine modification protein YeaZ [Lachnospiraceae bacterium]|nr:tRNA threonylcarbamoyl adenosine modification protein YeaZ [Lachnospiraceae bacterium]